MQLRKFRVGVGLPLLVAGLPVIGKAANVQWVGPSMLADSAGWSQSQYWSPSAVPGSGDNAVISYLSTGGVAFSVNYDFNGSGFTLGNVYLSSDANSAGASPSVATLNISSNTLNANSELVGGYLSQSNNMPVRGEGVIAQSGGFNNVGTLVLGYQSYGTGIYQLSGSGTLNASVETVGQSSGNGAISEIGGTNNISSSIYVRGSYLLAGGALSAPTESFGDGSGSFNQSGGSNSATTLTLGAATNFFGESDNYISGGTTAVSGAMTLGTVTAFSNGMGGTYNLWDTGTLTISGTGSCSAASVEVTAFSTLTLQSGTLTTSSITLDNDTTDGSTGQFVWTGGTLAIPNTITWDGAASGMGSFFGTNLTLVSGKTLKVAGSETLGGSEAFSIALANGSSNVVTSQLVVNNHSKITLSGGTLIVQSIDLNSVNTDFVWNSGVLEFSNSLTINPNLDGTQSGSIFGTSLTLASNKTLAVEKTQTLQSTGLTQPFSLTLQAGGTNFIHDTLVIGGRASITVSGGNLSAGSVIVNSSTGKITCTSGIFQPGSLSLSNGGSVSVSLSGETIPLNSLSIDSSSTFKFANDDLIVHNGSLGTLTGLIQSGYNNGSGMISLAALADTSSLTTLGILQNNNAGGAIYSTFGGQPVVASDVLVKYTYYGDATLDGTVNAADYTRIDNGYLTRLTGWSSGDFNYDATINGSDYTLIDNAFNRQAAQLSTEIANPAATNEVVQGASVPEPSGLLLIGIAGSLLPRRRGDNKSPIVLY